MLPKCWESAGSYHPHGNSVKPRRALDGRLRTGAVLPMAGNPPGRVRTNAGRRPAARSHACRPGAGGANRYANSASSALSRASGRPTTVV